MFSNVVPLFFLFLAVPALFAATGWWIELWIRRRPLLKLGFSPADLRSKKRIFKKWSEILVAKIPEKISLSEVQSHSWSSPSKYGEAKTAFEALGFRQSSMFIAPSEKCVVEFWLSSEPGLTGKIFDTVRGVYSEVTMTNNGTSAISFENTEDCGRRHPSPNPWVHCGLISPADLVDRALRQRQPNARPVNLAEAVSTYEQSVNECLSWRRTVGFNAEEIKHVIERAKKRLPT